MGAFEFKRRKEEQRVMKYKERHLCYLLVIICSIILCINRPGMGLVVSEIMYHPLEDGGISSGDETLEFIELYNNRAVIEDLTGFAFTNGIEYAFEPGTMMGLK